MAAACVQALPHNSPLRKSTPGPHLHFIGKFYKYSYEAFREYVEYPSYFSSISPRKNQYKSPHFATPQAFFWHI
jgi:hypothetical protein